MKLLIMLFSTYSCYFPYITSRYSPQHSAFQHLQSVFFPQGDRPSSTPI